TLHAFITCGLLRVTGPAPPLVFTVPETGRYYLNMGCSGVYQTINYSITVQALTVSPTSVAQDHRDVVLVSSTDGGQTWSPRVRVNDDAPRFDNSLPDVAVDAGGNVHVAWYDRRDAPECAQLVNTYWAFSTDGGQTFMASRRLSTTAQDLHQLVNQGWRVGDHLAVAAAGVGVLVLWTQMLAVPNAADDANIYSAVIGDVATAALVTRFEAEATGGGIAITWSLANPTQYTSVALERSEFEVGPWLAINSARTEQGDLTVEMDRTIEP